MSDEKPAENVEPGSVVDESKMSAQAKAWCKMDDENEAAITRAIRRLSEEREAKERDAAAAGSSAPNPFEGGENPQPTP